MLSRLQTWTKPLCITFLRGSICKMSGSRDLHSQARVAVVFSGSGVYDGTEVHEASAVLVHLSRSDANVSMFAPDKEQMHVIDHTKGEPTKETRNVLVESARIARGKIAALSTLDVGNHDAIIFPGGFGAAKNLSTFAVDGAKCKVDPTVERVIQDFIAAKKPLGMCCIAPVLVAKLIPGCEVTVGQDKDDEGSYPYAGTAGAINEMGAKHVNKNVSEIHIDRSNKLVTTPAFMCETKVHEIHDGVGAMVRAVLDLSKE